MTAAWTPPWVRVLAETRSPEHPRHRTLILDCPHERATVVRNASNPPQSHYRCKRCTPAPRRVRLSLSEAARLGALATNAKTTPEQRHLRARKASLAAARSTAAKRDALAARTQDAAREAAEMIGRGERVRLFAFADARDLPYERLRRAFVALTGTSWSAAHRVTT